MKKNYQLKRPYERKVRFSKEENEYISKKVKESPFTNFQNFARILLITGEVKMVDYRELYRLNGEVNRIGNNINQMARLAHEFDEISSEDIDQLTSTLEEIKSLVSSKLKEELKQERTV
jgi:hypothetical protein